MNKERQAVERDYSKEFKEIFENELCYKNGLNTHTAWADLMKMFACDISNFTEVREAIKKKRIKEYKECMGRLGGAETPLKLFKIMTKALWSDPSKDFLGDIYMSLGGSKNSGQFFTPDNVGKMMALINLGDAEEIIKENGYISIADPSSGSGVLPLTAANVLRENRFDLSTQALFYGQDIDETCVCMTFIQLALTGCAAVVKCGDSLENPCDEELLFPKNDSAYWYTTMYYLPEWFERRKEIIEAYRKRNASI